MTAVLDGVRILEVAEHTFVPAASALLADLGAEVIKIEHVTRGDAMRGLASTGVAAVPGDVHALLEHSNRGKKSLGLDLTQPDGLGILYKLAATSDVFLTNKLPSVRARLKIDVDHVRGANPSIIYVRGTGQGERGPDADKGSYDSLAFWARAGVAMGAKRPEYDLMPVPPAPGFGDSIGGMTIAGGIMGALFHRERTGKGSVVDVSLLGTGLWAMGQAMALSLVLKMPWIAPPNDRLAFNPLVRTYGTKDGRVLAFTCLQAAKYWPLLCDVIERPDLKDDARFGDPASLLANTKQAIEILEGVFASAPLEDWRRRLESFEGQWCVVQDTLQAAEDPQTIANGYLQECRTAEGTPFRLVAVPVQYDEAPATPGRAPKFNEHGDEILAALGLDWDAIMDLKVRGIVA
jgi:crotonobetainyl-CoA:carnitine CoA-transferase CaiB-like acyl-CoA transferase